METIACIFCHSTSGKEVIQESGFAGKKCDNCALIYIAHRPSAQEVIDLYGHEQAHISPQSHITGSRFRSLHSQHTLQLIKQYRSSGKLLEIGAGGGFFLDQARQTGFTPYALELNPTQADFIQHNLHIPCEQKPLSATSFGNTTFDVIYHNDVISHFHDPHEAFATMYAKLNKGGILLFETGNIADIDQQYYQRFTAFQYPDHLFFFGESTVKKLLAEHNFTLLELHRYTITLNLKLVRLTGYLQRANSPAIASSSNHQQIRQSYFKTAVKNLYHTTLFFTRYKLGALLPKQRKPQTMIIIAQKR